MTLVGTAFRTPAQTTGEQILFALRPQNVAHILEFGVVNTTANAGQLELVKNTDIGFSPGGPTSNLQADQLHWQPYDDALAPPVPAGIGSWSGTSFGYTDVRPTGNADGSSGLGGYGTIGIVFNASVGYGQSFKFNPGELVIDPGSYLCATWTHGAPLVPILDWYFVLDVGSMG